MEHSWEVATIAHALALIKNRKFGGNVDANAIATAALYHDVTEVITGDLPTPIKYHSKEISSAYKTIEKQASDELINLLPDELQGDYRQLMQNLPEEQEQIIKAADRLSAYLKCLAELKAGNQEFKTAEEQINELIKQIDLPEVKYFMQVFAPSYGLSLDDLLQK